MAGRSTKPIAAIASQGIVAGSSLLLQLVALWQLGDRGLGQFALLFGILVTINSIQSGWLGDSLTVLDRFDPGIRRALVRSQVAIVGLVFAASFLLALPIGGVDATTALLFGLASTAWVVEETIRRLLIARREFDKLMANDAAFAVGSFSLVGFVVVSGSTFSLETLVLALLAGAVVAIAVGVMQLPGVELSRGLLGRARTHDVASFAVWRAAQVGLRPGSQTLVRFIVVWAASEAALGQLEAARILLAPVLTVVNGAGVYLLPTYSAQVRNRLRLRPAVPLAMAAVASLAALYGTAAVLLRRPLTDVLTDGTTPVTVTALLAWTAFSMGFGAGVPAGNALVARGRSRDAFTIRIVDAVVGVATSGVIALAVGTDAVPFGLALGTAVGAGLLLRDVRSGSGDDHGASPEDRPIDPQDPDDSSAPAGSHDDDTTPLAVPDPSARVDEPAPPTTSTQGTQMKATARTDDDAPLVFAELSMNGSPSPAEERARRVVADEGEAQPVDDLSTLRWEPRSAPLPPPRPVDAGSTSSRSPISTVTRSLRVPKVREQDRWLWLVPLLAIVATEYKFRRRPIDDALGGSIDLMIIAELAVYGLIGLWAAWRLAPTSPRLTPLTVVMWGYILTTAASSLYSTFALLALARAVQLVILGAVVHLLAVHGTIRHVRRLVHGWIVLLTVSIAAGLAYVAPTTGPQEGRFTWLYVHSVSAGSMLALSVPMLLGLWLAAGSAAGVRAAPWNRGVYAVLLAVHSVFLLATRTRGSIGAAAIALMVVAWIWSGQRAKPQLVLASLVAGGASLLAFGGPVLQFLTRGESAEKIGTFNRRTEIWSLAWESFLDRPLHGLGFTSAKGVFFDETGLGGAHNAFVNVMIDVGLVGLVWWFALILAVGVAISRFGRSAAGRAKSDGAIGSARADHVVLVGLLVSGLVNSITTEGLGAGVNVSAIWLYLMVGWICVLRRDAVLDERPEPAGSHAEGGGEGRDRPLEAAP